MTRAKAPSIAAKLKIVLGAQTAVGPGKADLLQHIVDTGSIAAAGRRMAMSYRRAWLLVDEMNQIFKDPVVTTAKGGKGGGGGAVLTDFGRELLARFRNMQRATDKAIARDVKALRAALRRRA